jgi:glycosyltransferase involved in cell wall biosynthesis
MADTKLNVGFVTSSILAKTGFSTNIKTLLPFLYKTGKYNLFHLNQGMAETPEFQRFPWVNWGVFRPGTFDMNMFQTNEAYKRHCSYGNEIVEKFILDNKLDVVIHIEDPWSSNIDKYIKSKWFPYLKENFLQWPTVDSLPILPDIKTWAENCPNIWFWASFAEKALKKEDEKKYGHIKTIPGCFDVNEYYPILRHEKNELRKRNNIDKDTVLFFQLGRSQLRKLYPFTIESFAKFKKRNPKANAKLLFHCSAMEGWPFERLIKESGLNKEDVLFTYFCINCGQWEVKPLQGEFINCPLCGTQGFPPTQERPSGSGQKTAGVDSTISNKEMSKIFGLCDASVSPFTSGGYERFNSESLLCELPLLCSEYSAGEDFVCNDFVFRLDGTFTYEVGTGFLKHVPNINTMIKFYEKIYSMSYEERKEIGRKGRKWAAEKFDVSIIGKKMEEWLDSRKKLDWDFTYKIESKDPNAPIPYIENNKEFIKECYKNILKMFPADDDTGLLYWEQFLAQPDKTRDQMVNYMRNEAAKENAKNNVVTLSSLLDPNDEGKRILYVMPESAGDLVLSTALFSSLKQQYPWANLYVATKPEYFDILEGNPNIFKVLPYSPEMENLIAMEGSGKNKGFFEIVFLPHIGSQRHLSYIHNGKDVIAFNNK